MVAARARRDPGANGGRMVAKWRAAFDVCSRMRTKREQNSWTRSEWCSNSKLTACRQYLVAFARPHIYRWHPDPRTYLKLSVVLEPFGKGMGTLLLYPYQICFEEADLRRDPRPQAARADGGSRRNHHRTFAPAVRPTLGRLSVSRRADRPSSARQAPARYDNPADCRDRARVGLRQPAPVQRRLRGRYRRRPDEVRRLRRATLGGGIRNDRLCRARTAHSLPQESHDRA